jgi:hypothetical protein
MITPNAYEAFIKTGRKDITVFNRANVNDTSGGAYLIAQSAGMGGPEERAPYFELDYYIDNLTFTHQTAAQSSAGPLVKTDYRFKITEPYGFSFVSNLTKAQQQLETSAGGPNLKNFKGNETNANTTKNFYIIGIRFFGWDRDGVQVTGGEEFDGQPLDPNASGTGALFETYNEIVFTEFKFKIELRHQWLLRQYQDAITMTDSVFQNQTHYFTHGKFCCIKNTQNQCRFNFFAAFVVFIISGLLILNGFRRIT